MKKKVYIYPVTAFAHKTIPNPYLESLMNCLENNFVFVNKDNPSNKGIFDIWGYRKKIDFLFLNWIEDLPDKKGGLLQTLFFVIMVHLLKFRGIKIVWTMHNKLSHYHTHDQYKRMLFRFLLVKSDFIITHSNEGIHYASEYKLRNYEKIRYFPHPLEKKFIRFKEAPAFDILIWGSIIAYKGIDQFLQYLHDHQLQNRYKIRIVGKVKPESYLQVISGFLNDSIQLENRYIPEEELKDFVADARTVVFTYIGSSVLSSGVLMDTLSYGGNILAPDVGAFKDARQAGLISTFRDYDELVSLLDDQLALKGNNLNAISEFIDDNTWTKFSQRIADWII